MFEILKQRLLNVQHDITGRTSRMPDVEQMVDFDAGAKILEHYQSTWSEIHKNAEANAKKASEIDNLIGTLYNSCVSKLSSTNEIGSRLSSLSNLADSLQNVTAKIGDLQGLFEDVEKSLVVLEDVIETQKLQEKQLEQRFQLAIYKESKLRYLEEVKVQLEADHIMKLTEFEFQRKKDLQERQQTFNEVFEKDMEHYRQHGHINTLDSVSLAAENLKLEDVELDCDSGALENFLADGAVTAVRE